MPSTKTNTAAKKSLGQLTDDELLDEAHAVIKSHAAEIATIAGTSKSAVLNGLRGFRGTGKLSAEQLSDTLEEASLMLAGVRAGMSLDAAATAVIAARGVRTRHRLGEK